jgi:hypothetical protein
MSKLSWNGTTLKYLKDIQVLLSNYDCHEKLLKMIHD